MIILHGFFLSALLRGLGELVTSFVLTIATVVRSVCSAGLPNGWMPSLVETWTRVASRQQNTVEIWHHAQPGCSTRRKCHVVRPAELRQRHSQIAPVGNRVGKLSLCGVS